MRIFAFFFGLLTTLALLGVNIGIAANVSFPVDTIVSFSGGDSLTVIGGSTADAFTVSVSTATVTVSGGTSSSTFRSLLKAFVIESNTATATTSCTGSGDILTVTGTGTTTFSLGAAACTGGTAYREVTATGGGGSPSVPVVKPSLSGNGSDGSIFQQSSELCAPRVVVSRMIRPGDAHSPEVVRRVQEFLNEREGALLEVSGTYNEETVRAVRAFQEKYAVQILAPWGITKPTGIIYITTAAKINALSCGAKMGCPYFTLLTKPLSSNSEVPKIKSLLNMILGLSLDVSSERLDEASVRAVEQFQSRYRDFILRPWNLSRPTGWWYQTTIRQANKFMGCENLPPILLPSGVTVE